MSRKPKEIIAVVLDIGRSMSEEMYDKSFSYFDSALACVSMILQRKLVDIKSKDSLSLFLLGSDNTINSLHYSNIELLFPMSTVSWEMLQSLQTDVHPTKVDGDWLDAIVVAMNYIKDEMDGMSLPISSKKLIVLSNFKAPASDDQVDFIITGLKSLDIELTAIGPDVRFKPEDALVSNVIKEVGGVMSSFAEARSLLQYFPVKHKKPMAWNVVMTIGPHINILVSGYKMIGKVVLPSMKELPSKDVVDAEGSENWIIKETNYVKQTAEQTFVPKADIIKGFRFGSTIVPFSKIDEESLKYVSGSKCLSILGFTKEKNISVHHLVGDSTLHFKARRGDSNASVAMSALINALHEQEMVAVARRIYRDNSIVHLGVLVPKLHPSELLVYVELPFSDDVRQFVFQSLQTTKPTEKQFECIDKLIDSMDLMTAGVNESGEPSPAFDPWQTIDPYHQHFYHAVCYRALHPDSPLPPPQQFILDSLVSPHGDTPTTLEAVHQVKDNFPLLRKKAKRPRKTAAETFKQEAEEDISVNVHPAMPTTMAEITSRDIVQIGTVDPVTDFDKLIATGQPLATVAKEMGDVAANLVLRSFGSDDFPKACAALGRLRRECVARDSPKLYNAYAGELKEKVLARGKVLFLNSMRSHRLGLIARDECPSSGVEQEVAELFLMKQDEVAEEEIEQDQGMDVEDLLNDM